MFYVHLAPHYSLTVKLRPSAWCLVDVVWEAGMFTVQVGGLCVEVY